MLNVPDVLDILYIYIYIYQLIFTTLWRRYLVLSTFYTEGNWGYFLKFYVGLKNLSS